MNKKLLFSLLLTALILPAVFCCGSCPHDRMEMAILWLQRSAEVKALFYQGYNLARMELDRQLRLNPGKKLAVVVDIDETVLDNSPYQAQRMKAGKGYTTKSWNRWCNKASAKALPGAKGFLRYASSKGVAVFYISNRRESTRMGTLVNLKKEGFPQAENRKLLLRTKSSSKTARRAVVLKQYTIAVLCGDNLGDFSDIFQGRDMNSRDAAVRRMRKKFGRKFIVFPNPMYGAWESAVYGGNWKLSKKERAALRRKALRDR